MAVRSVFVWFTVVVVCGVGFFLFFRSGFLGRLNSDFDLAGIDANHDGVRDDVEALITERYSDEKVRLGARHLHQGIQAAILDPVGHDENMILCAARCLRHVTKAGAVGKEIESHTANTRARIRAYMKAEARDGGKIIGCPLDFEESCLYESHTKP